VRSITNVDQSSHQNALQGCRILVVSNRGPVQFHQRADGRSIPSQTSGGLATALVAAAASAELTWIAVAGDEADRHAFADKTHRTVRIDNVTLTARYVPVSDKAYRLYYDDTSNRTLWFLQHYLLQSEISPSFSAADRKAWDEGYVPVNREVANAVIDELQSLDEDERARTIVLLQDYHLYLVPGMIRAAMPTVRMGHFIHIPWPSPRHLEFIPDRFARDIMESMIDNDVIGVQTPADAQNFALCIHAFLPAAHCTETADGFAIVWEGRQLFIRAYPISIDPEHVQEIANGRAGQRAFAAIAKYFGNHQIVLRVDRVEPTKNIVRGLQAFDLLLEQHPELIGKVRFMQLLVPSREGVTRYRRYARQVTNLTQKINEKYRDAGEQVVVTVQGNNYARALAAMRQHDVMLVNSIIDGMHLGAKESAVVNERDSVLVVARTAGVYQELRDGACLGISPLDLQETADMLYCVLAEMSPEERQSMADEARRRVRAHTVIDWLRDQLDDLVEIPTTALSPPITPPVAVTVVGHEWTPLLPLSEDQLTHSHLS
jgi:trehalose 6-phosphate synthase